MASRSSLHRPSCRAGWLAALLVSALLPAGPAAAAEAPRITSVRPMPDRPYLVVDVAYPKAWPDTAFSFEADGRAAPARALGGGFDSKSNLASYLVFPGSTCKRLSASWDAPGSAPGHAPAKRARTAAARVDWRASAPALAVLLGRLGEREALFVPATLELQVFPPAAARVLQDGAPLEAKPVEAPGPGQRLRVEPRWRAGLNTIELVVEAPGARRVTRSFTFVLVGEDAKGGFVPGDTARLVYGEVGSRSGPFFQLAIEGGAVAVADDGFARVPVATADGWVLEEQVRVADLRAQEPGEAIVRILRKGHFTEALAPLLEHRVSVDAPRRPERSGLAYDPVEDDPRYAEVFATIDAEVDALLRDHPRRGGEGFCHVVWGTKKRLLREKYGITWQSPDELNPQVIFD